MSHPSNHHEGQGSAMRCFRCGNRLHPGDRAIIYTSPANGKTAVCASHVFPGGNCVIRTLTIQDVT